jgi:hypothetical protein
MDSRTVTITLEVRVDGDDVRGTARGHALPAAGHADAPAAPSDSRSFSGWLGLIGAIDALLGFPPDAGAGAGAAAGAAARALAGRDGEPSR